MNLQSFAITYKGVTKSLASWGLKNVKLDLQSFATDELSFNAPGQRYDATPLFANKEWVWLSDLAGTIVFYGVVTKTPASADPSRQQRDYVISGPWYFFEKLAFQQTWKIDQGVSSGQVTGKLVSTLRTTILVGNQSDGTSENLSQVATAVINYVLSTATAGNWPKIGNPGFVPFQLANVPPNLVVPLEQVESQLCSQILKAIFTFVPDAGTWFDYSGTTVIGGVTVACAKFYIGRRDQLTPVSLPCSGRPISEIKLAPRNDLVVPGVIVKYAQTNTIDGAAYTSIIPDVYPPNTPDPGFEVPVFDVELRPGNISYQQQPITTVDVPKDYDFYANTGALTSSAFTWISGLKRLPWLRGYNVPPGAKASEAPFYQDNNTQEDLFIAIDASEWVVRRVVTTLAEDSQPLFLGGGDHPIKPNEGPNSGGAGVNLLDILSEELLTGSITTWMTNDQDIYAANVNKQMTLEYLGSDKYVKSLCMGGNLIGPAIPLRVEYSCPAHVTNGSTQTYSQPSSITPSEPIPIGLAQQIYQGLSVPHYEGTVEITERVITGAVGMGNCLNLTGGKGDAVNYATMNAQPMQITWNIDEGKTVIKVGPPRQLNARDLVELLRAIRGRLPTSRTNEQQTGRSDGDNVIAGAGPTAHAGATSAPVVGGGVGSTPGQYFGSDASVGATPRITLTPGMHNGMIAKINGVALGGANPPSLVLPPGAGYVYVQCDNTFDDVNNITMTDNQVHSALGADTSVVPATVCNPGSGGGSGVFYEAVLQYVATVANNKATVTCKQLITTSRNFAVCQGAYSQPWS